MSAPFTVFVCRKTPTIKCATTGCNGIVVQPCAFKLHGRLVGKTCSREVCTRCANGTTLCPPHQRKTPI